MPAWPSSMLSKADALESYHVIPTLQEPMRFLFLNEISAIISRKIERSQVRDENVLSHSENRTCLASRFYTDVSNGTIRMATLNWPRRGQGA